ncbi:MAG: lytic transglycosylase domain-containing protein [Solirubrobacteraceae bacterium]
MTVTTSPRRSQRSAPAAARRRRAAIRRRRGRAALGVAAVTAAVVALLLALPLAKRAVNALGLPLQYSSVIRAQAADKHLDPALLAAVIYAETKFNPRTSSAGAVGLMQLMPQTATFLARRSGGTAFSTADLATPKVNIAYGSYYLRYLLNEYHGSTVLALAAYNGGETNVDHWVRSAHADGQRLHIGDIPFPETRAYVQRVLTAQGEYRRTYASQLGY